MALDFKNLPIGTRLVPGDKPAHVHHYTNVEGLVGILTSRTIWATDLGYLNDLSEYAYAQTLITDAVRSLNLGPLFYERLGPVFDDPRLFSIEVYASCFCRDGDLLSQWRAYGGEHIGYSIEFDLNLLETQVWTDGYHIQVGKIEYDNPVQAALVAEIVGSTLKSSGDLLRAGSKQIPVSLAFEARDLVGNLAVLRAFFKHATFAEEREWRILAIRHDSDSGAEFRTLNGMLVPYVPIRLAPEGEELPITRIRIGPCRHPQEAKGSLRRYLLKKNLSRIEVEASPIPLRT